MSDSSAKYNMGGNPYILLRSYAKDCKIQSKAYHLSEVYYNNLWRCFQYPLVVLSAVSSVCAGLNVNQYALLGLSLATLTLLGFDKLIDPKERSHTANMYSVEYGEIASNIKQFILANNRTKEEIKTYTEQVHTLISKWKVLNPPIYDRFVEQAGRQYTEKLRNHKLTVPHIQTEATPPSQKKKRNSTDQLNIQINTE